MISDCPLARLIRLARKHVGDAPTMEGSARLCLADAVALADPDQEAPALRDPDPEFAAVRAMKSLAYSVGISSPVYRKAESLAARI